MHHFRRGGQPALRRTFAQAVDRLQALNEYLLGQSDWLVDYAERHRAGLRVGTALTEGTANFLVNRRMAKSQQMRWSRRGPTGCSKSAAPSTTARSAPASGSASRPPTNRPVSRHRGLTPNLATVPPDDRAAENDGTRILHSSGGRRERRRMRPRHRAGSWSRGARSSPTCSGVSSPSSRTMSGTRRFSPSARSAIREQAS